MASDRGSTSRPTPACCCSGEASTGAAVDADPKNAPVLLQVHGGGWTIGSKDNQGVPLMLHMAARGWVCVAINYRLSPRVPFPEHLIDVKRAIRWVREHGGDYGADPAYIAITGGSAGGHLAALAALTPNDPEYQPGFEDADTTLQAAAPHYGIYDFAGVTGTRRARQLRDGFLGPRVLMKDPATQPGDFERASPLLRVTSDAPPFLVIHGTHDTLVPVDQARQFVRRLREVTSGPVCYAELPGTQHAFDAFPSIRSAHVVRGVERFLRWNHAASPQGGHQGVTRGSPRGHQEGQQWGHPRGHARPIPRIGADTRPTDPEEQHAEQRIASGDARAPA